MSYLGYTLPNQVFQGVRTASFSGNGSTRVFTLPAPAANVQSIEVLVNNVQQSPFDGSYTVSGATLTLDEAPSSGTNNIYVIYRDSTFMSTVPGPGTVGTAQIQNGAVIPADLSTGGPFWDTAGNVGIGTTSPDKQIEVENSSASTNTVGVGVLVTNLNTTIDSRAGIVFRNFDNYGASIWSRRTGSTLGDLCFGTNGGAGVAETNIAERMRIDGSGRVTTPFQPSFEAYRSSDTTVNPQNQTAPDVYNATYRNVGGHYNTSTGLFTAPVSGMYVFYAGAFFPSTNILQQWFIVNGVRTYSFNTQNSSSGVASGMGMQYLNANDTIGVKNYTSATTSTTLASNFNHTFFMGYLIG